MITRGCPLVFRRLSASYSRIECFQKQFHVIVRGYEKKYKASWF